MVHVHELYLGFVRYYNSFNISGEETFSTHTSRILSYFDRLGRMLGYRIASEMTMNKLIENCPKDLSNKKIDLTWWRYIDDDEYEYELGLESQQTPNINKIKQDIRKLVYLSSNHLMLYCSWNDPKYILNLVKKDFIKYGNKNADFLIVVDPWTTITPGCEGKVFSFLIDKKGNLLGVGSAQVSCIEDASRFIRIFSNAKWNYS